MLAVLTESNVPVVGIVMALQFGPLLLLKPLTGYAADNTGRRNLLTFSKCGAGEQLK